jgi:hypothetical protein
MRPGGAEAGDAFMPTAGRRLDPPRRCSLTGGAGFKPEEFRDEKTR